ncbi:MAG: helix-turn-helix domain-containing protein [Actinomycetes bacterium]
MDLLTTTEAARELGVSARSLARWAREGRLTPALVTPGGDHRSGRYLWNLDDLRDQLLKLRTRPEQ